MPPIGPSAAHGSDRSMGRARRWLERSWSKQVLLAMRYSQVRSDDRPSNRSRFRHALVRVSCTASSASEDEPSMR